MVQSLVTLRDAKPQPVGPKGSLVGRIAAARDAGDPGVDGDPASHTLGSCAEKKFVNHELTGTSVGSRGARPTTPGENDVD
jgi:hypothetical protein